MRETYTIETRKPEKGLAGLASSAIDPYEVKECKRNRVVWETLMESGSVTAVSDALDYFEMKITGNKPSDEETARGTWDAEAWWNNNAGNLRWIRLIREALEKVRSGQTETIVVLAE
jgi:hypothetical protein